jgi:hypothetical protein
MISPSSPPETGESVGSLAALLVSCIEEEERLLDSICQASDKGNDGAVLSLAKQLSNLRATTTDPKLCGGFR